MSSRPQGGSKGDVPSGSTSVTMNREAVGCLRFLHTETELRYYQKHDNKKNTRLNVVEWKAQLSLIRREGRFERHLFFLVDRMIRVFNECFGCVFVTLLYVTMVFLESCNQCNSLRVQPPIYAWWMTLSLCDAFACQGSIPCHYK